MNPSIIVLFHGIAGFLKFFIIALSLRIYLTWFPNINFYTQPFSSLAKMTDPYLRVFRGMVPNFLGFDISPLLGFGLLTFLIDTLGAVY
jgi:YggT family protein